jgi:murein DD-endopeptidase MepM/ murein hydrolase activator NlpD
VPATLNRQRDYFDAEGSARERPIAHPTTAISMVINRRRRVRETQVANHAPPAAAAALWLALAVVAGALDAKTAWAGGSSFDRWLRNPYPPADGFSFPVGDGEGGGGYSDTGGQRYTGWYVATRLGESYPLGIHTGEDWNGKGGGDTDHGQPVMAIANGKVVVAGRFANPWGMVVMIEHIVLDGHDKRRVRSQYAHLSRVDVKVGQVVRGRQVIGAIGKDPAGDYPAHLHLEIRSDLKLPATHWPSDHGHDADWIRERYLDPSAFIRAHRRLADPAAEPTLVLVDQQHYRMQYRVGGKVKREVEIALGQARGPKRREGDLRTPKGIYFVVDKQKGNLGGPWAEFFGGYWIKVNYPGPADARWGLESGIIDQATAVTIGSAWAERKLTPQNTGLGSGIGFHGWASEWRGGRGAHLSFGCVVLHPRDIAAWFDEVPIGTMVVIF